MFGTTLVLRLAVDSLVAIYRDSISHVTTNIKKKPKGIYRTF